MFILQRTKTTKSYPDFDRGQKFHMKCLYWVFTFCLNLTRHTSLPLIYMYLSLILRRLGVYLLFER